jgi:inorganic phosphate transporter, PiT family
MGPETLFLVIAVLLGFYVAWNIGANDVANAMGTSVGSGALSLKQAVILAAILEFCGAFFLGSYVSETVESGIVNPMVFANDPNIYICGMLASLLAAGVWLQLASYCGWPVSTTHSIVGAVLGFGITAAGVKAIQWGEVGSIAGSWVLSPIMGGVISFTVFNFIRRKILYSHHPVAAAKRYTPYFVFLIFSMLTLVLVYGQLDKLDIHLTFFPALGVAILVGLLASLISWLLVRQIPVYPIALEAGASPNPQVHLGVEKALRHLRRAQSTSVGDLQDELKASVLNLSKLSANIKRAAPYQALDPEYRQVERIFTYLQIISACFMAFAHGANDVANAIGPLAGVITTIRTGQITLGTPIPTWLLTVGGLGIVIGLATWGWRVIETVGKRITELTPTRGFAAEFAAAATILLASRLGLPVSTTHTLVGAVLGVGLARGIGAINLTTIRDIGVSWIITVPAGATLSILFYHIFKAIFL